MNPIHNLSDDEFVHIVQRAVALPEVPLTLQRAAIELWSSAQPTTLRSMAQTGLRLIAATLSFDSWAQPRVVLGMRSAASDTRHLLFSAMGRDIDLRISPVADRFTLTGQILGPDESADIELVAQPGNSNKAPEVRVTTLDTMGEFRLDDVSSGTYLMTLRTSSDEITLPPIEVGATSE